MYKSTTIELLAAAMVKAQKAMGNASKDAKNPFFKSKYADLNAVREACLPVLNENGISVLQLTSTNALGKQVVLTTLLHESGQYMSAETEIVCVKPNDPQAYGSAVSYARRYGLQAIVCIGAEDDDGEKAMSRTTPQINPIKEQVLTKQDSTGMQEKAPVAEVTTPQNGPSGGFKGRRRSAPAPSNDLY